MIFFLMFFIKLKLIIINKILFEINLKIKV